MPTPSLTNTPTPGLTDTPIPTRTPSVTPTPALTVSSTPTSSSSSDAYEPDDECEQAQAIPTDGTMQFHTFDEQGDTDWTRFEVTAGTVYLIEAQTPADSRADVSMVVYDECGGTAEGSQGHSFSPDIRLEFTAPNDGTIFLSLFNHEPDVAGLDVSYELSVRALSGSATPGALILVAGRLRTNDHLQDNIHFVTKTVYDLFIEQGYNDERIYYLATDLSLIGVDASPSVADLEAAITQWAVDKVGEERALTLYLIDHGDKDRLYLDKVRSQWITPDQLDSWLSTLQAAVPDVQINVIIEACYTGSFIEAPQSISGSGRVVITSTNVEQKAWASEEGAVFSDHFLFFLKQQSSLYSSFQAARAAIESASLSQTPWLDGDGDGTPNEAEDYAEAAKRGFTNPGTLAGEQWAPYIARVSTPVVENERATIQVEVLDDIKVDQVWAVIYPPSYSPPQEGEELVQESLKRVLLDSPQENEWYRASYPGFNKNGTYRLVIYAKDQDGLQAQPKEIRIQIGSSHSLYLPLVLR